MTRTNILTSSLVALLTVSFLACTNKLKKDDQYILKPHDITEGPPPAYRGNTGAPQPTSVQQMAASDLRRSSKFATLSKQITFGYASADISDSTREALDQIAIEMKNGANSFSKVRLAGFTDAGGSDSRNLRLSQERADNVRNYLISKGIPGEKLEAIGMGAITYPDETANAPKSADRRVEFEIVQ